LVLTGGQQSRAVTLESTQVVSSAGVLLVEFVKLSNKSDPKLSGIEINLVGPHLAHAVVGGPYTAVAPLTSDGTDGMAVVPVDGQPSHTHGPGLRLIEWIWKVNNEVVGTGEQTELTLPPGEHIVTLFVTDDGGNESAESTTITVLTSEYPVVESISPDSGTISGGEVITIQGSGFTFEADATIVHIGEVNLTSTDITIVDSNTITVTSPIATIGAPHPIAVSTPLGKSNFVYYTYIDGAPIAFTTKKVTNLYSPTTVAYGPDEKLYIGTVDGWLYKLTLDDSYNVLETVSSSVVQNTSSSVLRSILGLAFDPMDTADVPSVYVSHTHSFHGESASSSGGAVNGKVSVVSGSNMDQILDVITGLPAADHDHGMLKSASSLHEVYLFAYTVRPSFAAVNGIEFGDVSPPVSSFSVLFATRRSERSLTLLSLVSRSPL